MPPRHPRLNGIDLVRQVRRHFDPRSRYAIGTREQRPQIDAVAFILIVRERIAIPAVCQPDHYSCLGVVIRDRGPDGAGQRVPADHVAKRFQTAQRQRCMGKQRLDHGRVDHRRMGNCRNRARAVDQNRDRKKPGCAKRFRHGSIGVKRHDPVHRVIFQEALHGFPRFAAQGQKIDAARFKLVRKFVQVRHTLAAWHAPRSPEFDQQRMPWRESRLCSAQNFAEPDSRSLLAGSGLGVDQSGGRRQEQQGGHPKSRNSVPSRLQHILIHCYHGLLDRTIS